MHSTKGATSSREAVLAKGQNTTDLVQKAAENKNKNSKSNESKSAKNNFGAISSIGAIKVGRGTNKGTLHPKNTKEKKDEKQLRRNRLKTAQIPTSSTTHAACLRSVLGILTGSVGVQSFNASR